jgi:hypothetical protein
MAREGDLGLHVSGPVERPIDKVIRVSVISEPKPDAAIKKGDWTAV